MNGVIDQIKSINKYQVINFFFFFSYPVVRFAHTENVTYQQNLTTLAYVAELENVTGNRFFRVFIFEDTSNESVGYIDACAVYDDDWVYITSTETKDFGTDESLLLVINIIVRDTPPVTSLKLEPAVFTDELGIPHQVSSPTYTVLHFRGSISPTTAAVSNPTPCSSFAAA